MNDPMIQKVAVERNAWTKALRDQATAIYSTTAKLESASTVFELIMAAVEGVAEVTAATAVVDLAGKLFLAKLSAVAAEEEGSADGH